MALELRWRSYEELCNAALGTNYPSAGHTLKDLQQSSDIFSSELVPVRHRRWRDQAYDRVSLEDMLKLEHSTATLQIWRNYYAEDAKYDHTGESDVPPVKRVVAINGVNVKTEVALVLRLNSKSTRSQKALMTRYTLDTDADLIRGNRAAEGLSISKGIIYEEPGMETPSGDGTVPYVSLNRSHAWQQHLGYKEVQLDNAKHRDMLNDWRFHQALLNVLQPPVD